MNKLIVNPILSLDSYKLGHYDMYPSGMNLLYSSLICRNDKYASFLESSEHYDHKVVFFGLQYIVKDFLINSFNSNFFGKPKHLVIEEYKHSVDNNLGVGVVSTKHIEALYDLGYLPIEIKAVEEGSVVNLGIPLISIVNTHPNFSWLVNYLETTLLNSIWKPISVATVAHEYKKLLVGYNKQTSDVPEFVNFQGHDFSMRGQNGPDDAMVSGGAFLTSFKGSDTLPAAQMLEAYYGANPSDISKSVRATEHSIMCTNILYNQQLLIDEAADDNRELEQDESMKHAEYKFYKDIIKKYPTGILSLVSDQYDYWNVICNILPVLKYEIMSRNGSVIIRGDSGDPVRILCGYTDTEVRKATPYEEGEYRVWGSSGFHTIESITEEEKKGTIQLLWETFGGTINSKGFKVLDSHIGTIYGDALTIPRVIEICERLISMGFSTENFVCGIGAYSLNGSLNRDTFGMAMKATYCQINDKGVEIYKKPKTDQGKNSPRGLLKVEKVGKEYLLHESQTWGEEAKGELKTVFKDGKLYNETTLDIIRSKLS